VNMEQLDRHDRKIAQIARPPQASSNRLRVVSCPYSGGRRFPRLLPLLSHLVVTISMPMVIHSYAAVGYVSMRGALGEPEFE